MQNGQKVPILSTTLIQLVKFTYELAVPRFGYLWLIFELEMTLKLTSGWCFRYDTKVYYYGNAKGGLIY